MTKRQRLSMIDETTLAIDRFNRGDGADSTRFELQHIDQDGSEVRTCGELVNRRKQVRLALVLGWKFDSTGRLARIEAEQP